MKPQEQAKHWIERYSFILDTETTGLEDDAEACEISIITTEGEVLFDEIIKPSKPIGRTAMGIHGIRNMDIKDKAGIEAHADVLRAFLENQTIVVYNAAYDKRIIENTFKAAGLEPPKNVTWQCAMLAYAEWRGVRNPRRRGWRWHKLTDAMEHHGLAFSGMEHRALPDAKATLQLMKLMAGGSSLSCLINEKPRVHAAGLEGERSPEPTSAIDETPPLPPQAPPPEQDKILGYPKWEWAIAAIILFGILIFILAG
ncbi:DNA polymerase-3 subunit epsilon [Vreelandella titanicae]|uniref:3'-5' exonuclease n=1 Tax=Vreelandella titanicae TaxID=664683 RepID=UPI0008863AC5|nr:3'-5' exonuclease [Halomonas titanicae]SDI30050.1 DNA polymerase-3 subunit epsilon [Halomonas titanicae]